MFNSLINKYIMKQKNAKRTQGNKLAKVTEAKNPAQKVVNPEQNVDTLEQDLINVTNSAGTERPAADSAKQADAPAPAPADTTQAPKATLPQLPQLPKVQAQKKLFNPFVPQVKKPDAIKINQNRNEWNSRYSLIRTACVNANIFIHRSLAANKKPDVKKPFTYSRSKGSLTINEEIYKHLDTAQTASVKQYANYILAVEKELKDLSLSVSIS